MFVESKPFPCNNKLKYVFFMNFVVVLWFVLYEHLHNIKEHTALTLLRTFVNIKEILLFILHFVFVCAALRVLKNVNTALCWYIARACNGAVPDTGGENIILFANISFCLWQRKVIQQNNIYI